MKKIVQNKGKDKSKTAKFISIISITLCISRKNKTILKSF